MTTEDLIPLLEQAGISQEVWFEHHRSIERLVSLVISVERERMKSEGWRHCAEGQITTQYCGLLEAAVKAEREAILGLADSLGWVDVDRIRARGESK